ncbi:outer membrane protein, partial [Helicobacter ailurogastricus]|uniref:outer membrane protein n=1 Tax=Helicobacter ailurogastricus TaxID=1578720 RepID=UPI00255718A9
TSPPPPPPPQTLLGGGGNPITLKSGVIFGNKPATFTISQTTYFSQSQTEENQEQGNPPTITANLNASELAPSASVSQANALLNATLSDLASFINGATPFLNAYTSYATYAKEWQDLLGVKGTLTTAGQNLVQAYQSTQSGNPTTGLAGNLKAINALLGQDLITQGGGGTNSVSYYISQDALNTLQILKNINTDFNGGILSPAGVIPNVAKVVQMLTPTTNSKGNTTPNTFMQNVNTIANNILNTSITKISDTSNADALNAVLTALSQNDTNTLTTLINPNNLKEVQQAYTAIKSELNTLQKELGANSAGQAINQALDLSDQLGYLQNGFMQNGYNSYGGDKTILTELQKGTLNANGLAALLMNPTKSNVFDMIENLAQYANQGVQSPTSDTTTIPNGKALSSWITAGLSDQNKNTLSNNANLASLLGNAMSYSTNSNQLASLLSNNTTLTDIIKPTLAQMAANAFFKNSYSIGDMMSGDSGSTTNNPALILNDLRALQYSYNLYGNYLNSIGLGDNPNTNLTPTEKLALYEFNQALTGSNGLIAQTKESIQTILSPSTYQEFLQDPSKITAEVGQIIQANQAVNTLYQGYTATQEGSLASMLANDNTLSSNTPYANFAYAAINSLAQDFSPTLTPQGQEQDGQMANLLNNFSTLSTKDLSTMTTELSTFNSAVQKLATDTSFNGGKLITSTSSISPNGITSTNATSYIEALIKDYQPQAGQSVVLATDPKDSKPQLQHQAQQAPQTPTQQAANALHALMQNLNTDDQTAQDTITFIEGLNTYEHNNALLTTLVGAKDTATIDSEVLAYAQSLPLFQSLTGLNTLKVLQVYQQAQLEQGQTPEAIGIQDVSGGVSSWFPQGYQQLQRYIYLTKLAKEAATALKTNAPAQGTIPTATKNAPLTPGAKTPTAQNQGQQGQGAQGQNGQTTNNNPQGKPQGQNPNNPQNPQTASQSLQNLINSIVGNTLQNIQQLQSAMNHYFNQVEQTIKSTTSAIISSLDNVSAQQAVQNIVAGLENYASDPENNLVGNPEIPQGFKTEMSNFIQGMQASDIDLELMQLNLDSLINQASQMRVALLDDLASSVNAQNLSSFASFVALPAKLDLSPNQAQNTQQAVQGLNNLLIYLNAAKNKMAAYAKESPEVFLNRAGGIGLPNQTTNSNANMYGIDVQVGYKQFFGKKRRWGLRYYGSFSYQRGVFYNRNISSLNDFVYGAGVDALYNFYESKDSKYTTGVFLGFMLAGSSWVVPGYHNLHAAMQAIDAMGGHSVMHTSYFQIPLNIGFRTNVTKHHGFEVGLRIPLAANYYFKGSLNGAHLETTYKRNVAVYFNYVYNF